MEITVDGLTVFLISNDVLYSPNPKGIKVRITAGHSQPGHDEPIPTIKRLPSLVAQIQSLSDQYCMIVLK